MDSSKNGEYDLIRQDIREIMNRLDSDILDLKILLSNKETEITNIKEQLLNTGYALEGNRQLVNKLLGDISKLQNDIEWYRKTYEKRSFFGVIKEKILRH